MRVNYIHRTSPQFKLLAEKQIEELHTATLQILERTGVTFESQEAIDLLGEAGADVSNPSRVKIPSYLVEQAIKTSPKTITVYTRDGEPAFILNGMTSHFGAHNALNEYLDPYTGERRECYVEDIADMARVIDASPDIEWSLIVSSYPTVPEAIADKVAILQSMLNTSKPITYALVDVPRLKEVLELCSMVAGGEKQLRAKPFLIGSSEPSSPLVQGKAAMEKSLLCAEKGIPNLVYSAQLAGATAPATFPAVLAAGNAEFLSQLVVIQLKKPGAPVIFGAIPSIMDMKTTIASYGAPEAGFLVAAMAEIGHYYKLPVFGKAGNTDSDIVDAQAATEATYQILLSVLSGADFIHGLGEMNEGRMISPEFAVLGNEIIDMVKVLMSDMEINDETLPLDLIDRVGPGGSYISEKHTLQHFRKFWTPTLFDRSMVKDESTKRCRDLLKEKTLEILQTHQPRPLPEELMKELKKQEAYWLKQVGLKEYPKR
ncbi:trimethylamine methyltransferase family protein [Chloroflexota bacterium]